MGESEVAYDVTWSSHREDGAVWEGEGYLEYVIRCKGGREGVKIA